MRGGGGSRFRVPRFYYAPLKFYLVTKKDTWEQHPANLIPPLTTKHASALSVDGTPSLARCRDFILGVFAPQKPDRPSTASQIL